MTERPERGFPTLERYCDLRHTEPTPEEERNWRSWCQWVWVMCQEAESFEFVLRKRDAA